MCRRTSCDTYHIISSYSYMIWYDMIWYDMVLYDMIWYDMIWYDMIWYDMIYDISLSRGGSHCHLVRIHIIKYFSIIYLSCISLVNQIFGIFLWFLVLFHLSLEKIYNEIMKRDEAQKFYSFVKLYMGSQISRLSA